MAPRAFPDSIPLTVEYDSFNPKPEAMVGSRMDRPRIAPAIASGFGLNEQTHHRSTDAGDESPYLSYQEACNQSHDQREQRGDGCPLRAARLFPDGVDGRGTGVVQ